MKNHAENVQQKLVPDPFSILFNNKKVRYFEEGLSKSLKKVNFIFLSNPVPLMDKVIKNKSGLELVPSRSPGHETSSEKFFYSLYVI